MISTIKYPKSITFTNKESNINLIIHGQGVMIFENTDNNIPCCFNILNNDKTDGFFVKFGKYNIFINRIGILEPLIDTNNVTGLSDNSGAYYWLSLDSQNQRLIAGVGEPRMETKIYSYQFNFGTNDNRVQNKLFLESLVSIEISDYSTALIPTKLLRDPITLNVPLIVKGVHELTMNDIANSSFLPSANLSLVSKILYDCISGKNFILNDDDFPEFSQAIEHSIVTEGCWCNTRLKEKSTEFNQDKPNFLETYLRITMGENNGNSTGIPYVMEIWPIGHYSPIHSHGGANAVIRVLNGTINVSLYPFLNNSVEPFAVTNFIKNDITWISSNLNQIHKLENLETSSETCITIQCYIYNHDDHIHYDYFDYIDDNGSVKQYEPDSDMDFVKFKKLMKQEWLEMMSMKEASKCCLFNFYK